jgi:hypothetical protein
VTFPSYATAKIAKAAKEEEEEEEEKKNGPQRSW